MLMPDPTCLSSLLRKLPMLHLLPRKDSGVAQEGRVEVLVFPWVHY